MKRFLVIFLPLALHVFDAAAQLDSTRLAQLDSRLENYFVLLEAEDASTKSAECDALIEAATDQSLRQQVALKIYDHYLNSPLMGDEAVAIHLIDKWFSGGEIAMRSERELLDAKLFADFNRQSLVGMSAPQVTLSDPLGEPVTIPLSSSVASEILRSRDSLRMTNVILSEAKDLEAKDLEAKDLVGEAKDLVGEAKDPRYQILYFFDTGCAKCKLETAMLRSLLDDKDYPVALAAVYVGRDEDAWRRWRDSTFVLRPGRTRVNHLWDPEDESGYQMKYGITATPRMFLVDPDGVIIGRGLDTDALVRLLDIFVGDQVYRYGSEESSVLFDQVFSLYGAKVYPSDVMDVASMLEERTLSKGDTISFKHLEGDLLYYLTGKRGEGYKEGLALFVKDKILSRPEIWSDPDDSLEVVGLASFFDGLLSKAPVGARIPKTHIRGWNKLRRKGGYIFFKTEGCPVCAAETAAAEDLKLSYLPVEMDSLERQDPLQAKELLDYFDLVSLPSIIEVGKRGVIKRRYVSFADDILFLGEKD